MAVIILLLLLFGALYYFVIQNKLSLTPDESTSKAGIGRNGTGAEIKSSWPIFRGGPDLRGVAPGKLSELLKLVWTFKTGNEIKSSAVISAGRVFIGSGDGHLYALDLKSGREAWRFACEDAIEAPPCIVEDMVVVGSLDEHVYALEKETGRLVWKYKTGDKIIGSVNWFKPANNDNLWILAGSYDNFLYCLDSKNGNPVWKYKCNNYINGTPAVHDGRILFGGCDALIHVVSALDGQQQRLIDGGSYIAASVAVADHFVYIGNYEDTFMCADIDSGAILWQYTNDGYPYYASAAVTEEWVLACARDYKLYCFDRQTGRVKWTFSALAEIDSSPVVCDNKVLFGSDDGWIYMVDVSSGKEIWSFEIGEIIASSPAVAQGMVVIGADDGIVYCFGSL